MTHSGDKTKRVLLVDDSNAVRHFLGAILRIEGGFDVTTAADGAGAVDLLSKSTYDILLVDLNIPVMSGVELYGRVVKEHPDAATRVVFMRADSQAPQTQNFFKKINRPFLLKPFTVDDLVKYPTACCGVLREKEPHPRSRTGPLSSPQQAERYPAEILMNAFRSCSHGEGPDGSKTANRTAWTGIQVGFKHTGLNGGTLVSKVSTVGYRIAQETLTGLAHQTGVSKVTVRVRVSQEKVHIKIKGNGGNHPLDSIAFISLRERALSVGGKLKVHFVPGVGTAITAELPLTVKKDLPSFAPDSSSFFPSPTPRGGQR